MSQSHVRSFSKSFIALALSLTISSLPLTALAGPGDVNSVNDGQVIQNGTYYNTPGNKTTFQNSGGSGLWVKSGTTVRGLESNLSGTATGNGGWLHFYAPGQAVRLDGDVSVSGLLGKGGIHLGNGGRVTIDSAFLYQNGNIFANGVNGGLVQFNVGGAMFGPNARIEAKTSAWGQGGQILVNSPGFVDIQQGTVFDTSGMVIGTYDTNIINIEGGLINMEGILRADGVDGSQGGIVRLIATGMSETECVDCALSKATGSLFSSLEVQAIRARQADLISRMDGDVVIGSPELDPATGHPVANPSFGLVSANGGDGVTGMEDGGAGGDVVITAQNNVVNGGVIRANGGNGLDTDLIQAAGDGGNGGTIAIVAGNDIINDCLILADGGNGGNNLLLSDVNRTLDNLTVSDTLTTDFSDADGGSAGDGGLIAFGYGHVMENSALIQANGGNGGNGATASGVITGGTATTQLEVNITAGDAGHGGDGGLIVFSGDVNPTGNANGTGFILANGGNGGLGGNATAKALIATPNDPILTANATAGNGGNRGDAGLIVAPDPAALPAVQNVSSNTGNFGASGDAYAEASGTAGADLTTIANATTGSLGKATAIADSVVAGGLGNAVATANATSGNFGQSTATAHADSEQSDAFAHANSLSGDFGSAISNVTADALINAAAIANAATLVNGFSLSNATATSFGDFSIVEAASISGENGTSVANAIGTAVDWAFVEAVADAGDNGYASADANAVSTSAIGFAAHADAKATTGTNGKSRAVTTVDSQDKAIASAETVFGAGGVGSASVSSNDTPERTLSAINNGTLHPSNGTYGPGPGLVGLGLSNGLVGTPPSAPPLPRPTPGIDANAVAQVQDNELLLNNGTAILLSKASGTGGSDTLTAKLDDATVRTLQVKDGSLPAFSTGAYDASTIGNFVIGDMDAGTTLELNQFPRNVFDELRFMTVLKDGNLVNPLKDGGWSTGGGAAGGHISWLANFGSITNDNFVGSGGTFSGGSVNLMAGGTMDSDGIVNNDQINTSFGTEHGGSIMLKSANDITNNGLIKADANHAGGKVVIVAKDDILNNGEITANALGLDTTPAVIATATGPLGETLTPYSGTTRSPQSQGGIVKVLSGDVAINNGIIEVDGAILAPIDDVGTGGYAQFHGNALAMNTNKGVIQANGNANGAGGQVIFTSGDSDHANDADSTFGVPGIILVNGVDVNIRETAANFGQLNAVGGIGGGRVAIGGNNQIHVGTVNANSLVTFVGQNINGFTAVSLAAACDTLPPGENPSGSTPPQFGLFQNGPDDIPNTPFKLLLSLENTTNGLFSANGSNPDGVTDAFMALAFEEYHNQLLLGVAQEDIEEQVMLALEEAGATAEVMTQVLKRVGEELRVLVTQHHEISTGQLSLAMEQYYTQLSLGKTVNQSLLIAGRQLNETGVTLEIATAVVDQMEAQMTNDASANIFMASQYLPVTERIIKWAMDDYHRQLSMGNTIEEARRHMVMYLTEVGVDSQVALSIQQSITNGEIEATPRPFRDALDVISVGASCGNLESYMDDQVPPQTTSPCAPSAQDAETTPSDQLVQ